MSEYQYYEFRAVDRPIDRDQMAELRKISSRAEITPTGLTNTYNYGDFRGDPEKLMTQYFDAFVYVANWGTRRLMFRIPRGLIDVEAASAYAFDHDGQDVLSIEAKGDHVLIGFDSENEGGDDEWSDGDE